MELTQKTFIERLQHVQAELREITKSLASVVAQENGKKFSDVDICKRDDVPGIVYFTFRLKEGYTPSPSELEVRLSTVEETTILIQEMTMLEPTNNGTNQNLS